MNASRLRYSILSRSSEPEMSPCNGLSLWPRISAKTLAGASAPSRADNRVGHSPFSDQRPRDVLVVQRADLFQRVRERVMSDVVQQRRGI